MEQGNILQYQKTRRQHMSAYDPQASGEAERAVQEVKAQLRAVKLGLEARIKKEIRGTHEILEWMIPYAANTINRFLIGIDGRTAHYRVHLKNFGGKVFEFGEQVLAKPKRTYSKTRKRALTPDSLRRRGLDTARGQTSTSSFLKTAAQLSK